MEFNISNGFSPAEPGEYIATVVGFTELGVRETPYGPKQQVRFDFLLPDGKTKQPMWVNVPDSGIGPRSRMYEVITAIMAANPEPGLKSSDLIGRKCRITIERKFSQTTGKERSQIVDIRTAPRQAGEEVQEEVPF